MDLKKANEKLHNAIVDLEHTHSRLLQTEKMAAIGQLAAGIAHEINNPLGFIKSNLDTLHNYAKNIAEFMSELKRTATIDEIGRKYNMDYILDDLEQVVGESVEGEERIERIVGETSKFSHRQGRDFVCEHINEIIDRTLEILSNELRYKAEVEREYAGMLPLIRCFPQQLEQVFLNLLLNAIQVVQNEGRIKIRTASENLNVVITIEDNGCGISRENLPKILNHS